MDSVSDALSIPLSRSLALRLAELGDREVLDLWERVDQSITDWCRAQLYGEGTSLARDFTLLPALSTSSIDADRWARCALLYIPRKIAIQDPVASQPCFGGALTTGVLSREDAPSIRAQLIDGVQSAARYAPAVERKMLSFLPTQSVRRLSWEAQDELVDLEFVHDVQQRIFDAGDADDLEGIGLATPPSVREVLEADRRAERIRGLPPDEAHDRKTLRMLHRLASAHPDAALLDFFLSHAWLTERLRMFGVVGSTRGFEGELGKGVPSIHHGVADLLTSFEVPGPDSLTLKEILNLRENEEVFAEFRESYARALALLLEWNPRNQTELNKDFSIAVHESLTAHQRQIISRKRASPTLDQWLPLPFTFSAIGIEHVMTQAFPIGSLLTTVAATIAFVVATAMQSKESKSDQMQRRVLTSLMQT